MPHELQALFDKASNGTTSQEEFMIVLDVHSITGMQKAMWTGKAFNLPYAEVQQLMIGESGTTVEQWEQNFKVMLMAFNQAAAEDGWEAVNKTEVKPTAKAS
jgi:hypothetical protein